MERNFNRKLGIGPAFSSATVALIIGFGWADLRLWQDLLVTIERLIVG